MSRGPWSVGAAPQRLPLTSWRQVDGDPDRRLFASRGAVNAFSFLGRQALRNRKPAARARQDKRGIRVRGWRKARKQP